MPPPNRPLQASDLDRSVGDHPRPRRQARRRRARDPQAGRRPDLGRAARASTTRPRRDDHRLDREARALRPREPRCRRRSTRTASPIPSRVVYDLLARPSRRSIKNDDGGELVPVRRQARSSSPARVPHAEARSTQGAREGAGEARAGAEGLEDLRRPGEDGRHHVRRRRGRLPRRQRGRTRRRTSYYLFKYDPANASGERRSREMTGERPAPAGHAPGLRHADRRADRDDVVHGRGRATSSATSRARSAARAAPSNLLGQTVDAALRDRPRPRDPVVAVDRLEQYPNGIGGSSGAQITGIGSIQEAKDLALVLQTGALPVEFQTLARDRRSRRRSARTRSARRCRAAIAGLLVVAIFLLVFYRFLGARRGARPRHLRGASCTR